MEIVKSSERGKRFTSIMQVICKMNSGKRGDRESEKLTEVS